MKKRNGYNNKNTYYTPNQSNQYIQIDKKNQPIQNYQPYQYGNIPQQPTPAKNESLPFFQKTWFIILMMIFVSPVGIFLMWYYKEWNTVIKIVISVFLIFYFMGVCAAFNQCWTFKFCCGIALC